MCYEEFDLSTEQGSKEANVKFLAECGHAFCGECFKEFFQTMIELQYRHDKLKCPQFDCDVTPNIKDVENIVSSNCLEKFKKFNITTAVAKNKNLLFCSKNDCDQVLNKLTDNKEKKKPNKLTCSLCNQKTCYLCKQEYIPEKVHDSKKCMDQNRLVEQAIDGQIVYHKCPQCDC